MFRGLVAVAVALVAVVAALFAAPPVSAQACRGDNDCRLALPFGAGARCVGDTLIRSVTRCISGRCLTQETGRQRCGSGASGRCVGGSYIVTGSRCDALNGTCSARTDAIACKRGCSCRGNQLVVFTGQCSPAIGCHKSVKSCPGGCSCDPEPVCREGKAGKKT